MDVLRYFKNWQTDDDSNLLLRLEYDHQVIRYLEMRNHDGNDEITIGRDADKCTWAIPQDSGVSKMHARISFRNGRFAICDLGSTNGTFCKGKRLKSPKEFPLKAGDEFIFGDSGKSKLIVEYDKSEEVKASNKKKKLKEPCAWLKYHDKYFKMMYDEISIGSNESCDLCLQNKYVSKVHAILIHSADGTFAIKNKGKNGTTVNTDPVLDDIDYPLKENDVLNICGIKLTFLTHKDSVPETFPIEKFIFWLVTAAVVLWIGYIAIIKIFTLPAEKLYRQAEIAMGKGEYDKADHALDKAKARTDAPELLNAIGKMLKLITDVKATWREWDRLKEEIVHDDADEKTFQDVSVFLNDIQSNPAHWTWIQRSTGKGTEPVYLGAKEKPKALIVKNLLDARANATGILNMDVPKSEEISIRIRELDKAREEARRYSEQEPYIKKINDLVDTQLNSLKTWEDNYSKLNENLKKLQDAQNMAQEWNRIARKMESGEFEFPKTNSPLNHEKNLTFEDLKRSNYRKIIDSPPDYRTLANDLNNIIDSLKDKKDKCFESIRNHAGMLLPAIESLERQTEEAKKLDNLAAERKFKEVMNFKLEFDPKAEWGHVSELKIALENFVRKCMKKDVEAISYIYEKLDADSNGRLLEDLRQFEDDTTMALVLSCDSLDYPFPGKARKTPCGKYDELLGIDYFFSYLNSLDVKKVQVRPAVDTMKFQPRIRTLFYSMKDIESNLNYLESNFGEVSWLQSARAKETRDACLKLIKRKDAIVNSLLANKAMPGNREFLVSHGIALYLSSDSSSVELKSAMVDAVKKYKENFNNVISEKYDNVKFEERIKNRKEILKLGMPGHGLIREFWQDESEAMLNDK